MAITSRIYDVRDFGAVGDGKTLCTKAIQAAIDAAVDGGTVLIAGGDYVSGTLGMKSGVTLRVEAGAKLSGSRDIKDYWDCGFYHNEMKKTVSLIYGLGCDHITLEGNGEIDMNGDAFMDFESVGACGADTDTLTDDEIEQTVVNIKERPTQPIFFDSCTNLNVRDLTLRNAPCWTVTFSRCENIKMLGVTVLNLKRVPNNDGVHFSASRHIVVGDCIFLCGDDCFAATCITDTEGVCEDIVISNCICSSRSAAIRFGHLYSKVRRVAVNNVVIKDSNRGFCIFSGDNGYVEDVVISNAVVETKIFAGGWWGKGEAMVICAADSTGRIENVTVNGLTATTENPIVVCGTDGNVKGITIENARVRVREGKTNEFFRHKIDLQPNRPCAPAPFKFGDVIYTEGVEDLSTNLKNA